MSDIWHPRATRLQRIAQSIKSQTPYDIQGRLSQAAPVPPQSIPTEPDEGGEVLFVGPEDPGLDAGYSFWFDTDDVIE